MKKTMLVILALALTAMMVFTATAETAAPAQYASAVLDQGGNEILVTVDLTGGWSVEFARGAIYLFQGDPSEAVAIGITQDEEVFTDYRAEATASESYRELDGCESYTQEDGTVAYLIQVGEDAYFTLLVDNGMEGDEVLARIQVEKA